MPINHLLVKRRDARKNHWMSSKSSFIISNWKYDSDNAYLVWGYYYNDKDYKINAKGTLTASKKGDEKKDKNWSGSIEVTVAEQRRARVISAMSFDKCITMLDNRNQTQQLGIPLHKNLPVYEFGKIRTYFTIEKQ
jgi:hypothetical protein